FVRSVSRDVPRRSSGVATQHEEDNLHAMKYGLGVVIGKFYPPLRGHKLLIDEAISQCEQAVVIVCGKPSDGIPGELRGKWLRDIHPQARVMVIDDRYDEN